MVSKEAKSSEYKAHSECLPKTVTTPLYTFNKTVPVTVWTSMGSENLADSRTSHFDGFQLNKELFQNAKSSTIIMHCLPMNKGQEITEEMANHENSELFNQVENRLHAQKALMIGLWNGLNQNHHDFTAKNIRYFKTRWFAWHPSW